MSIVNQSLNHCRHKHSSNKITSFLLYFITYLIFQGQYTHTSEPVDTLKFSKCLTPARHQQTYNRCLSNLISNTSNGFYFHIFKIRVVLVVMKNCCSSRRRVLGKRMLKDKKMFSILLPILLGQGLPYADGGGKN